MEFIVDIQVQELRKVYKIEAIDHYNARVQASKQFLKEFPIPEINNPTDLIRYKGVATIRVNKVERKRYEKYEESK